MSYINGGVPSSGPGSGTVTSITFNGGLTSTPDPVTTIGTATIDQTNLTVQDGTVYWDTGTQLLHTTAVGTAGQLLTSNGAGVAPTYQNKPASSISITGDSGGALSGAAFTFTGGATGLTFAGAGSTETLGGTLAIAHGGTNATSMTNTDGVVYYDGTRLVTTAVGSATQVLTSNGAGMAPTFQAAAGGITTAAGDSGTATGATVTWNAASQAGGTINFSASGSTVSLNVTDAGNNTIIGSAAGTAGAITGTGNNTALGQNALHAISNSAGGGNVAIGTAALQALNNADTTGNNCAVGWRALQTYTGSGNGSNLAFGSTSLFSLTTGSENHAFGTFALDNLLTGVSNCAFGFNAGGNYTGAESSNICFNNTGTVSESNVLRIGAGTGTGAGQLAKAFISGIFGKTVSAGSGTAVFIDNTDQLGTVLSSARFKENIENLNDSKVLDLQPVTFNYKENGDESMGLIAEEVEKVMPDLVVYDKEGLPLTVKYMHLPILLLAEIKKLRAEVNALKGV